MTSPKAVFQRRGGRKPSEARRWLQHRVSRRELHRLAPRPPRRSRGRRWGHLELWDQARLVFRTWWLWLLAAISLLAAGYWPVAVLAGAVAFVFYHTSPNFHPAVYAIEADLSTDSPEFVTTMAGVTGMPLVEGNRVVLYNNGDEFFPAMLKAIEGARESVTMEQYIFWKGRVGVRFAEAFAEKAQAGVPVKLLVDAVGSATVGDEILGILEEGGCQLAWFRPVRWYGLNRANNRTHRRSLMIDGRVAFTGGAGIADHWLGTASGPQEWRDIQVRVDGPAALAQQAGFAQNWLVSTGEVLSGTRYFPVPEPAGTTAVQTILSSPLGGAGAAGTMYVLALQCAHRHVYLANSYFVPSPEVIDMLAAVCARGVQVKLMVAGEHNDTWWARQNSVRLYGRLLDAGVEIYEFAPTMMHEKIMIVDGLWATVGTTNFDNRSFALNEETNICFHDPGLVAELSGSFEADLARCTRVDVAAWRRRGLWRRAQEQFASLLQDQV